MIPPSTQERLLSQLLHEYLADPEHKTNVHLHHEIPYQDLVPDDATQKSFFNIHPTSPLRFAPKDPEVHRSLSIDQFLSKKLRWITLGGQYDWTRKAYPFNGNPPFPQATGGFLHHIFPSLKPEAAIINLYRPGDVLSVHRDVSEECNKPLLSVSLGCEAILVLGLQESSEDTSRMLAVRLRSGDAVCLTGAARFAWHGIPRILGGTCPSHLTNWPAPANAIDSANCEAQQYEEWRGWMHDKRVNLSVRQIYD